MWIVDSCRGQKRQWRHLATLELASGLDAICVRFHVKRMKGVLGQRKLLRLLNCQKILVIEEYFKTVCNMRQETLEKMDQNQHSRYILR